MSEPRLKFHLGLSASGFHRLAYREWGLIDAPRVLVCVHGLTRNGRDFEEVAAAASAAGWRVICPDVVGRGESDALADPAGYSFPQYLQDMNALIARLDVEQVDWLGTSMGGLIGMLMAAQPKSPLRRLVLNDIGPFLPRPAIADIASQVAEERFWPDFASASQELRQAYEGFGPLDDEQWQRLIERSLTQTADGRWRRNYDPALGNAFATSVGGDVDLWSFWEAVRQPVLVLRGEHSQLLTPATAAEMKQRGLCAEVVEIAGSGHAPALMRREQIELILDWLGRP